MLLGLDASRIGVNKRLADGEASGPGGLRRGVGEVMLDGERYFASFPEDKPQPPGEREIKARMLTPGLLAALEELDRELRSFLNEASRETSDDGRA